jgi:GWxTD domain-containing protein
MNRLIIKITLVIILYICAIPLHLYPQDEKPYYSIDKEYLFIDPLVFYGKDSVKGRVDVYAEVPMINLNFSKNPNTGYFEAFIDYTIVITNSAKEVVINNTYSETIQSAKDKLKDITESSEFIVKNFLMVPDKYTLNFTLRDRNTTEQYSKEKPFTVKNQRVSNILFSDLMIVSDYKENEQGKKIITPLINNNIGNLRDFYIFFEIYSANDIPTTSEFHYKITGIKDNVFAEGDFSYVLQYGENKKIEKLSAGDLIVGDYKLEMFNKKTNEVVSQRPFIFRWSGLPISIKDLDAAISQLMYIANSVELDSIKAAKTNIEKEQRFIRFWKSKDPTPNTPRNEVMLEYYNRIRVANERFSQYYKDGWKTDMGMVYIIYGEPSYTEKSSFGETEKPWESWEYYDIKQKFVFIDDTGFGDFRLITPIYDRQATRMRY